VITALLYNFGLKKPNTVTIKAKSIEHSIILNLQHKSDIKLYNALSLTNYTCQPIPLNLINCSLNFKDNLQSLRDLNLNDQLPLISYTSKTGKNFRVFKLKDGSTHLEVLDSERLKMIYSFTSTTSLLKFSRLHESDVFSDEVPRPSILRPLVL